MKTTQLTLTDGDHAIFSRYRRKCQRQRKDMSRIIIDAIQAELDKEDYTLAELAYDLRRSEEDTLELLRKAGFARHEDAQNDLDETAESAEERAQLD
jgi:hypothetical protein